MPPNTRPFLYIEKVGHCPDCGGPIDSYMGCACDPPFVSLIEKRDSPFLTWCARPRAGSNAPLIVLFDEVDPL